MANRSKGKIKKQLSKTAKKAINNNNDLFMRIANALGIASSTMTTALYRNVIALNQQHIVQMIAETTGLPVDEILIDYVKPVRDPLAVA